MHKTSLQHLVIDQTILRIILMMLLLALLLRIANRMQEAVAQHKVGFVPVLVAVLGLPLVFVAAAFFIIRLT